MIDKFKNIILKIIDLIKNDYKRFIYILFISSLIQSLIVLGYVLIAYSTNFDFNLGLFIFIFPLAMFIQVLPIAISQLGFREYIFMNIFIFFGMSGNQGVAISLIFAMLSLTILIIMYLLFSIFMYFSKHTYEK
jgi:uncharacterized membrane protein YbhN (UPF0104 family)